MKTILRFWKSILAVVLTVSIFIGASLGFHVDLIEMGRALVFEHSTFLEERADSWGTMTAKASPVIAVYLLWQAFIRFVIKYGGD